MSKQCMEPDCAGMAHTYYSCGTIKVAEVAGFSKLTTDQFRRLCAGESLALSGQCEYVAAYCDKHGGIENAQVRMNEHMTKAHRVTVH